MHELTKELIADPNFKYSDYIDFEKIWDKVPNQDVYLAHTIAGEYLQHKRNVKINLKPLLKAFKKELEQNLEEYNGDYDMGVVWGAANTLFETIYRARGCLKESNKAIKYFHLLKNDGRVHCINHHYDPDDGNYYVDLAMQEPVKKPAGYVMEYPIYAPRVCLTDCSDIGEALFEFDSKHPTKALRCATSFELSKNTLNAKPIAHIRINEDRWIRIPYVLVDQLLGSEHIKVTWSKREAYLTDCKYYDFFHVKVIDPDCE